MEELYPRQNQENDQDESQVEEKNEYQPLETDEEKFEREFYEPAALSQTSNIIGWGIAIALFLVAIWLLWIALK